MKTITFAIFKVLIISADIAIMYTYAYIRTHRNFITILKHYKTIQNLIWRMLAAWIFMTWPSPPPMPCHARPLSKWNLQRLRGSWFHRWIPTGDHLILPLENPTDDPQQLVEKGYIMLYIDRLIQPVMLLEVEYGEFRKDLDPECQTLAAEDDTSDHTWPRLRSSMTWKIRSKPSGWWFQPPEKY